MGDWEVLAESQSGDPDQQNVKKMGTRWGFEMVDLSVLWCGSSAGTWSLSASKLSCSAVQPGKPTCELTPSPSLYFLAIYMQNTPIPVSTCSWWLPKLGLSSNYSWWSCELCHPSSFLNECSAGHVLLGVQCLPVEQQPALLGLRCGAGQRTSVTFPSVFIG